MKKFRAKIILFQPHISNNSMETQKVLTEFIDGGESSDCTEFEYNFKMSTEAPSNFIEKADLTYFKCLRFFI